jgi:predicted transcriptional regulator with HTH domain
MYNMETVKYNDFEYYRIFKIGQKVVCICKDKEITKNICKNLNKQENKKNGNNN